MNTSAIPIPTHKSYRKLSSSIAGKEAMVLTDLNVSITESGSAQNNRRLVCRYYSVKTKLEGSWRLAGHSCRLSLESISFSVSEKLQSAVRDKGAKTPHAYLKGLVSSVDNEMSDKMHDEKIQSILDCGGKYLHYCPYRVDFFVVSSDPKLPLTKEECEALLPAQDGSRAYCYETGILVY